MTKERTADVGMTKARTIDVVAFFDLRDHASSTGGVLVNLGRPQRVSLRVPHDIVAKVIAELANGLHANRESVALDVVVDDAETVRRLASAADVIAAAKAMREDAEQDMGADRTRRLRSFADFDAALARFESSAK